MNTITTKNEIDEIIKASRVICQQYNLPEVCTNVLLFAMVDKPELTSCVHLKKVGVNIIGLQYQLAAYINKVASPVKPLEIAYSNAVSGLIYLNGKYNTSGLSLLKTILKYKNTSAYRLLDFEKISLNSNNQLYLKTI